MYLSLTDRQFADPGTSTTAFLDVPDNSKIQLSLEVKDTRISPPGENLLPRAALLNSSGGVGPVFRFAPDNNLCHLDGVLSACRLSLGVGRGPGRLQEAHIFFSWASTPDAGIRPFFSGSKTLLRRKSSDSLITFEQRSLEVDPFR